jgi:putative redox protein
MRSNPFDFTGALSQRLAGRLDLPEGPVHAYALFAHCFTCSKNSLAAVRVSRALTARGFGVLRFDFTGLGDSGGDFGDSTFSGSVQDLLAAAAAMEKSGISPGLLIGHSLGGAAVLAAAADLPGVKAVATIAAPFDVHHVTRLLGDGLQTLIEQGEAEVNLGGRSFKMRRAFVDDLQAHDQQERIAALRRPLLVLHAPLDDTVGIDNAAAIFQAAWHPKSFVSLDDADHLLTRPADAGYVADVIATWAARYLGSGEPSRHGDDRGEVVVDETGAGNFQVEVRAGGIGFFADEPAEVGGLGSGPTPYDLLSAALGACTAMTLRLYARRKDWALGRVRVRVGHSRTAGRTPPDGFMRDIVIEGDLTPDQSARLMEIAERCPVHRTLENGARVETRGVASMPASPPEVESASQHVSDMKADADQD